MGIAWTLNVFMFRGIIRPMSVAQVNDHLTTLLALFSAGIDFRLLLTSDSDVKSQSQIRKNLKKLYWPQTHNIGIQMKRKELTKTLNLWGFQIENNALVSLFYAKLFQRCEGYYHDYSHVHLRFFFSSTGGCWQYWGGRHSTTTTQGSLQLWRFSHHKWIPAQLPAAGE